MVGGRTPGESTEPVELIDPRFGEHRMTPTEEVPEPVKGPGTTRITLVGGVLVVAGLLWALGRAGPPPGEEAMEETTTSTVAPTTTTAPRSTSTASSVVAPGPMLGERTGLALFYGGDGPLQQVDLDTGVLTPYGLVAHPVAETGTDLVLYLDGPGMVGWVPLLDPGQQVSVWKRGQVALRPGAPSLLWVLDAETDTDTDTDADAGADEAAEDGLGVGQWELFDTRSSEVGVRFPADLHTEVEAAADGDAPLGGAIDAIRPGPFFSTRADGVYSNVDAEGAFRRVALGRLLAHDGVTVLAGTCSAEGTCELSWIDTETGQAVDRPLPGGRPRVANLVAGGAWLHSIDWDGTSELLELATGRRIEHVWATARPTLSPDGRWLAEWFGTTVVLSDLSGEGPPRTVSWVEAFDADGPGSLLFAPTP